MIAYVIKTSYEYKNDKTGRTIPSKRIRNWIAKTKTLLLTLFSATRVWDTLATKFTLATISTWKSFAGIGASIPLEDTASEILDYLKMIDRERSKS